MATVVKRSISLPADVFAALEAAGSEDGSTLSATLTEAAQQWLVIRVGLRSVNAWERKHGAFTAAELAEGDALLDAAGVGVRR